MPHGGSQTERGGMHSSVPNMKISEIGKLALRSRHMPSNMNILVPSEISYVSLKYAHGPDPKISDFGNSLPCPYMLSK